MTRVYVSLGSNVDRDKSIRGAVRALEARFAPLALSPVYETPAEGFDGEAFYNLVVGFDTELPLDELRQMLADIEVMHGRVRRGPRFGPRTIDLDILLYGDLVRHEAGLDLPRGEIGKYAFVLAPLADVAPRLRHPETGRTMEQMWREFNGRRELRPVALTFDSQED